MGLKNAIRRMVGLTTVEEESSYSSDEGLWEIGLKETVAEQEVEIIDPLYQRQNVPVTFVATDRPNEIGVRIATQVTFSLREGHEIDAFVIRGSVPGTKLTVEIHGPLPGVVVVKKRGGTVTLLPS